MVRYNTWTLFEENYLRHNYGKISLKLIIKILNRSARSIVSKANRLGLTHKRPRDV